MSDSEADRSRELVNWIGPMLEGQPTEIVGAVIAELLASWLMAWPAGADRAYALGTITGAALKLCGGINAEGKPDDVSQCS